MANFFQLPDECWLEPSIWKLAAARGVLYTAVISRSRSKVSTSTAPTTCGAATSLACATKLYRWSLRAELLKVSMRKPGPVGAASLRDASSVPSSTMPAFTCRAAVEVTAAAATGAAIAAATGAVPVREACSCVTRSSSRVLSSRRCASSSCCRTLASSPSDAAGASPGWTLGCACRLGDGFERYVAL
jgi:hypothetical protein